MADQGKWFKLWESALDDQDLENLSVHEWFSWARFGTYLKKHGKDGKIRLRSPATAVINLLRLPSFSDVISMVKRFPNYMVEEIKNETANVTFESVTFNIRCLNWPKYQGDFSTERVRRHRSRETANVTAQEERRRDVEEKRRDETPKPPLAPPFPSKSTAPANGHTEPEQKQFYSTLKIAGKPVPIESEDPDPMTPEEMREIREANMQLAKVAPNGGEDVF